MPIGQNQASPQVALLVSSISLAILRIRPQTRCGPTMGLPLTPARWKRCVPGSLRVMQTTWHSP